MNRYIILDSRIPDIFARKSVSADFVLPKNAKNVRLKYIVTGHGGHSGGDEFVQKKNILSVDGKEVYSLSHGEMIVLHSVVLTQLREYGL